MTDLTGARPLAAGAVAFAPDGVLFLGDNKRGAIFAYDTGAGRPPASLDPFTFESIDERIGAVLGVSAKQIVVNGMAVHPTTREPFLSLGIRDGDQVKPAVVRIALDGAVHPFDLGATSTVQELSDVPDEGKTLQSRAGQWPVPAASYYEAKARTSLRSMTIVDMKVHGGELFVSGVSNQEFCSTIRRVSYPFTGPGSETQVEIYHVAHGEYETRAPVRAMQFATLDGQDMMIAAYACSPLVTIPVEAFRDGAKVTGKTIGDMGNGQPISMVLFRDQEGDKLFVTNAGRGPMIVPLKGLEGAPSFTPANRPGQTMLSDTSPFMPAGPVGKQVLFVGSSLRADLFSDRFFVSLTRYAESGDLTLETLPVGPLPARIDKITVEMDFPGFQWGQSSAA